MATTNKPPKTRQTTPATPAPEAPGNTGVSTASAPLVFTEITGTVPTRLTKIIGLNADGTLRKETAANLSQGHTQRVEVTGLAALRDHLDSLTSDKAVAWGTTQAAQALLCTRSDTEAQGRGAIARTRENFTFSRSPGIFMIDHDGWPGGSLNIVQLRARLLSAAPALSHAPMLGRPSASAGCMHPNGQSLTPLGVWAAEGKILMRRSVGFVEI